MIKEYSNGLKLIEENKELLDQNKYLSSFFYLDASLLTFTDKYNYGIKVSDKDRYILALKVIPYSLLLYGDSGLTSVLFKYLKEKEYEFNQILCSTIIGDEVIKISKDVLGRSYYQSIGMDFMESNVFTSFLSDDVKKAKIEDVDEIYENTVKFHKDCHLNDKVNKDSIIKNINNFRIIKIDGKVASMASFSKYTEDSYKIGHVYTKDEYRNRGYARKVVNVIKNEIINMGKVATLNVDQKNPVSNHLYESLGFKKVFSQGIYEERR